MKAKVSLRLLWSLVVIVFALGLGYLVMRNGVPFADAGISKAYLMAFHACDGAKETCSDPRQHQVYLAQSDDGLSWEIVPNWQPYTGSVPDVIRRGDTVYLYTPNQVVRCSLDAVCSAPEAVHLGEASSGFVDPSLIVNDEGKLVLFFLYGEKGADPAQCASEQTTCVKRIGSATEVDGSNGTEFTLDAGDRAIIELNGSELKSASDPDIFFDGTQYVLYTSHGSSIAVWTSPDLEGSYERVNESFLSKNTGGIASGFFDETSQRYWTYAHTKTRSGESVIRKASHQTLTEQVEEADWQTVLSASDAGLGASVHVESPSFFQNASP